MLLTVIVCALYLIINFKYSHKKQQLVFAYNPIFEQGQYYRLLSHHFVATDTLSFTLTSLFVLFLAEKTFESYGFGFSEIISLTVNFLLMDIITHFLFYKLVIQKSIALQRQYQEAYSGSLLNILFAHCFLLAFYDFNTYFPLLIYFLVRLKWRDSLRLSIATCVFYLVSVVLQVEYGDLIKILILLSEIWRREHIGEDVTVQQQLETEFMRQVFVNSRAMVNNNLKDHSIPAQQTLQQNSEFPGLARPQQQLFPQTNDWNQNSQSNPPMNSSNSSLNDGFQIHYSIPQSPPVPINNPQYNNTQPEIQPTTNGFTPVMSDGQKRLTNFLIQHQLRQQVGPLELVDNENVHSQMPFHLGAQPFFWFIEPEQVNSLKRAAQDSGNLEEPPMKKNKF